MKVVINRCHGGFGLSEEAIDRYIELAGLKLYKQRDDHWSTSTYYTVPYDEFQKVHKKDKREGNYKSSNALCWSHRDIPRNDSILVQVVKELGEKANGRFAELKIVDIPLDIQWTIEDYDGDEWVTEKCRTWR
jgi:hypothetical protein